MKVINWFVGGLGVASLIVTLLINFGDPGVIRMPSGASGLRMKPGTTYYHEANNGYGILAAVRPSNYDPSSHVPTYEFIIFDGSINNANAYFSPLAIEADEESALIHIDSPEGREKSVSVYHTKKKDEHSYLSIGSRIDGQRVSYTDTDGDFIPDRRITNYRGKGMKIESISYIYKEIDEQDASSNP